MDISFGQFIQRTLSNPPLMVVSLLTLAVILVNGWTDAPNAISTAISTRSIRPKAAILMAAILNFAGVIFMMYVSTSVADTIYSMVDFGENKEVALIALCAALVAIVIWAVGAWWFGIPTSESHALIAALTGAAIAANGSMAGINFDQWVKVIIGLFLATVLGFALGYFIVRLIQFICRDIHRGKSDQFFKGAQVFGAGSMAFMHGAQDGQKFIGVFMLGMVLTSGGAVGTSFSLPPLWLMVLCSLIMGLGTSIGGNRIIKTVGMDMVRLDKYQGFAADIAGSISLLVSSLTGYPVSTTQTKTTAIMGVGASKRLSAVNWVVVKEMLLAWVLTFPGCGLIGFLMAKLFIFLF